MGLISFFKGRTGSILEKGKSFLQRKKEEAEERKQKAVDLFQRARSFRDTNKRIVLGHIKKYGKQKARSAISSLAYRTEHPQSKIGRAIKKTQDTVMDFVGRGSAQRTGENLGDYLVLHADKHPFQNSFLANSLSRRAMEKNQMVKNLEVARQDTKKKFEQQINFLKAKGDTDALKRLQDESDQRIAEIDSQIEKIVPLKAKTKLQVTAESTEFALDVLTLPLMLLGGGTGKAGVDVAKKAALKKVLMHQAVTGVGEGFTRGVIGEAKEGGRDPLQLAVGGGIGAGLGLAFFGGVKATGKIGGAVTRKITNKTNKKIQEKLTVFASQRFKNIDDIVKKASTTEEFLYGVESHRIRVKGEIDALEKAETITRDQLQEYNKLKGIESEIDDIYNKGEDGVVSYFERQKPDARVLLPGDEKVNDIQEGVLRNIRKQTEDRPLTNIEKQSIKRIIGVSEERLKDINIVKARSLVSEKFRLDKFPDDAQDDIAQIIIDNGGFQKQRRGVISDKAAIEMAQSLEPPKLKPGQTLNKEEATALGQALASTQKKFEILITQKAKLLKEADPKVNIDLLDLEITKAQHEIGVLSESYFGARAEAGRALQGYRMARKALETRDIDLISTGLKEGVLSKKMTKEISRNLNLLRTPEEKFRFMRNLVKPTWADKVGWYTYTNMLSSPKTHVRNFVGNILNMGFRVASKPAAVTADMIATGFSKMRGGDRQREVFLSELKPEIVGMYQGMESGMRKAVYMMKNGFTLEDVQKGEFTTRIEPFKGKLGMYMNSISHALEASDLFFRSMSTEGELHASAWAAAKKKGLKGDALIDEYQRIVKEPPLDLLKGAEEAGKDAVFRTEGGKFVQGIKKLRDVGSIEWITKKGKRQKLPAVGRLVVPFVETPANIFKKGVEASPVGFIQAALKESPRNASLAAGRAALGSLFLAPVAWLAATGRVSGNGPKDSKKRQQLYDAGWRPNSVLIGEHWVPYQNIIPLNLVLGVVGNVMDMKKYDLDGEDMTAGDVGSIVARTAGTIMSASYLQGVNNLFDAMTDPDRAGKRFIENTIRQFVPLSALQGNVARSIDDTLRKPETIIEGIKTYIPGLSKQVAPMINTKGEPVKRPFVGVGGFNILEFLSPERIGKKLDDSVLNELDAIDYAFTDAQRKPLGYKLSGKDYAEYKSRRNFAINFITEEVIKSPGWNNLTSTEKAEILDEVKSTVNKEMHGFVKEVAANDIMKEMEKLDSWDEKEKFLLDGVEKDKFPEEIAKEVLKQIILQSQ